MLLAVFFDTKAHRNAAALALRDKFAGHARMMGAVEDYGVSGGSEDGAWQLWATLEFPDEVYDARCDAIVGLIKSRAVEFGVQAVGLNGRLVTL